MYKSLWLEVWAYDGLVFGTVIDQSLTESNRDIELLLLQKLISFRGPREAVDVLFLFVMYSIGLCNSGLENLVNLIDCSAIDRCLFMTIFSLFHVAVVVSSIE